MLIEGLIAYLAADSSMQTQLGTPATRNDSTNGIFPLLAPGTVSVPYIVLQQVGGISLQESFAGTGRLQSSRWRFSCYGSTFKQAATLAKVLKRVMISCSGVLRPTTADKTEVCEVWLRLEADGMESLPHGTVNACHRDFEVNYLDYDDA